MASLEFYDKHNMVAYLEKSEGSEGFHQIIDFLTSSHIHYALTESLTFYASTIEQFWQTAALCTIEVGIMPITATIDRKVKLLVTEASIRRHLKLEDFEGLNTLPTAEIFEQLAHMGFIQILLNKYQRLLSPHTRTYPTPLISQTTHVAEEATQMPYESPLQSVHSLGRVEGNLSLHELTVLCTSLSKKVKSLESELHQTKQTYSAAFTKLIKRGRKISDIDKDPTISLVQDEGTSWFQEDPEILEKINDDTEHNTVIPEVSTAAANLVYIRRSVEKRKDKGKAIMTEPEPEQTTTKLKLRQERDGLEAAIRLQEHLNEKKS
ncbi:hypothetical protein Tco_0392495 [Tanacetum coccineum]